MDTILIVVDALRRADVGCYGRVDDTTPNLDRIAADSLVFDHAFSQSNYTDICLSSLLSGKAPNGHGVNYHGASFTEENLEAIAETNTEFLPQVLSRNGIETVGLDWMGRWHRWGYDEYGVGESETEPALSDRLFSIVKPGIKQLPSSIVNRFQNLSYRLTGIPDPRADCEQLTDLAIERLRQSSDDIFMFAHYWDVHPPFLPPAEYEEQFTYDGDDRHLSEFFNSDAKGRRGGEYAAFVTGRHETLADSKEAYDGAIAWVDAQIGRLYDHLKETGRLDETLLIVTADHGHFFGEHDIFSDNCSLYDGAVQVPLIIHHPDYEADRIEGLVQHTDVRPTIHDFYNIPVPSHLRGNLLPTKTREYVFAEAVEQRLRMIRTDRWKLIQPLDVDYLTSQYWYDQGGAVELYDLETDPSETNNVAETHPTVVADLESTLKKELDAQRTIERAGERGAKGSVSDEEIASVRSNLQSLGYLDER
jgi:arylsulfatase A-like enzyme